MPNPTGWPTAAIIIGCMFAIAWIVVVKLKLAHDELMHEKYNRKDRP